MQRTVPNTRFSKRHYEQKTFLHGESSRDPVHGPSVEMFGEQMEAVVGARSGQTLSLGHAISIVEYRSPTSQSALTTLARHRENCDEPSNNSHLNSFSRLLERDSNQLGWMPTLDQVNKTLIANQKPTVSPELEVVPSVFGHDPSEPGP